MGDAIVGLYFMIGMAVGATWPVWLLIILFK